MNQILKNAVILLGFLSFSNSSHSQCTVLNRVASDGSMQYYMEPVNFYWTSAKSLKGCIVTDKESFFLELQPLPFPEKSEGRKLKKNLVITLSDGATYELEHFDTRYLANDTVMEMLYLINKEDMERLLNLEVSEVKIDMMGNEGIRAYVFKLHKSALKEQLACFLSEKEKSKKK